MLQEHHHMSQNSMQRSARMNMQQMGPPPTHRTQPMLMSIQPAVPASHTGVLVSMPPGPALISTPSMPQPQPKVNAPAVYHFDTSGSTQSDQQELQQKQHQQHHHPHLHHQHHLHQQQPQQQQQQPQHNMDTQQNCPNTNTSSALPNGTLANIKEKTPMCLVNELARYNKIMHQYQLTEESGPAHKKTFTVTLKLGNEKYVAEGPSIKKAQHSAAAMSLAQTEFKHPPSKVIRNRPTGTRSTNSGVMTPTVELNALAMKRGERPVYILEASPQQQNFVNPSTYYPRQLYNAQNQPRFNYDTRRNIRPNYPYNYNRFYGQYRPNAPPQSLPTHSAPSEPYTIRLRVGDREYPGVGLTVQAARHDAAAKAIDDIKNMGESVDRDSSPGNGSPENEATHELNTELKSPISLVHEIALKRNLNVIFDVLSEKGPPHMKIFITQCRVGNFVAEGEGNSKKISKKRAAEKMLDELLKLPPLPNVQNIVNLKRKRVTNKKKTRNLIKVNMNKQNEFTEDINPISRLIQIQQANKEREPIYTVLEERGASRKREFVMQASINGHSSTGIGPNKKVAKRNAAEALLHVLGYNTNPLQSQSTNITATTSVTLTTGTLTITNPKPVLKGTNDTNNIKDLELLHNEKSRKVTFVEEKNNNDHHQQQSNTSTTIGGSGGRQLVPGVLLVSDQTTNFTSTQKTKDNTNTNSNSITINNVDNNKKTNQSQGISVPQAIPGVRSKDQLLYLAQLLKISVQFSDFPKANHEMYLTLVSLSTTPPQVCHGEGPTTEASHEKAALEALKVLSELGLDIVNPNNNSKDAGNEMASIPVGGSSKTNNNVNNIQNGVNK